MKKQLLIILGLTFLVGKMSAQLTLDHTFDGTTGVGFPYIEEFSGYYSCVDNNNTLYLYNSNYSLYKTVSLNLPSGYSYRYLTELGRHLINTDDKVEFFVAAAQDNAPASNNYYCAKIINEDGSIIQDFGFAYILSGGGVHKAGNQLRFCLSKGTYNQSTYQTTYQTDVYICHGNYNSVASFENENTTMQPYPNPTTTLINLPYHIDKGTVSTINIYNINGQLVDSYNIGGDFEMITIDVNNYAKGIYVYEYNGISNRFVVQ
jgi:hypothetical protein